MEFRPSFQRNFPYIPCSLFLILSFWVFSFANDELPKVPPDARAPVDTYFDCPLKLERGIQLVYEDRFQEATTLFNRLQQAFPNHPAPYFYRAAAYWSWMSSYRFNKFQSQLEEDVQKAIDIGNELLKTRQDDPWLNFYIGATYGYQAFFRGRSWNFIGAYVDGRKGLGNLNEALEKDPTLYDAYLGLGAYNYWRTARSSFIRIIAFWMPDKRDLGLEQMEFAAQHGRYTPDEATMALVTALYDCKKYCRALEVLEEFMAPYQTQLISSLYLHGRLLVEFQCWPEVRQTFTEILGRLENYRFPSIGYQVECKYWMALALQGEDKPEEALQLAEKALEQSKEQNRDVELEGQFDSFDDIKGRLDKLAKTLKKSLKK
jgi:tetratricopeptide (TPR) repeat protein